MPSKKKHAAASAEIIILVRRKSCDSSILNQQQHQHHASVKTATTTILRFPGTKHGYWKMPSTLITRGQDGPVTKRQRLNGADAPRTLKRESKLFSPFRVCTLGICVLGVSMLTLPDNWISIFDSSTFYIRRPGPEDLPDYNLRRTVSSDLRSQARTWPHLPHSTADSRGYHCDIGS